MTRSNRVGRFAAAVALVAAAAVSAGRTASSDSSSPASYQPPAWMAEYAAQQEELNNFITACMAEAGYHVKVDIDGHSGGSWDDSLSPQEIDVQRDAQVLASSTCYDQAVESIDFMPPPDLDTMYDHTVQTAECIRANGYPEIGEPPSRDTWKDQERAGGYDLWIPYRVLSETYPDITEKAWYDLKAICVEGGITYAMGFREPPK